MIDRQFDVEFTKNGSVHDADQVTALLSGLAGATDLLVLSHGWNNNMDEARGLYDRLLASWATLPHPTSGPGSKVAVMRVFWPSKKFTDADLIPGGGAASASSESDAALMSALEALKDDPRRLGETDRSEERSANIDHAIRAVADLENSPAARKEFVLRIRAVLNPDEAHADDGSTDFFRLEPDELFTALDREIDLDKEMSEGGPAAFDEGGAASVQEGGATDAGGAANFIGDFVSGAKAAARRIANFATYYQMKTRAGAVGRGGVATTLARVRERHSELPIHLVGHSFGGRLVTAAAAEFATSDAPTTLTLLQAAFSHNGLAEKFDGTSNGAFRTVIDDKRISGPIVITHTKNDLAVGIAYPLASRIARDGAAALGDKDDPYGGMGRNGAQKTPEVSAVEENLRDVKASMAYAFVPGGVYNLLADAHISDHSDVDGPAVASAIAHAMRTR